MAVHDPRVTLIVNRWRQLSRNLLLLVHYSSVFAAFAGRSGRWMVEAVRWLCIFTRFTASVFDSLHSLLTWERGNEPEVLLGRDFPALFEKLSNMDLEAKLTRLLHDTPLSCRSQNDPTTLDPQQHLF